MEWPASPPGVVDSPEIRSGGTNHAGSMLGIDLGKNPRGIIGLDASGAVVWRRRVKRETLIGLVAKSSPWRRAAALIALAVFSRIRDAMSG